MKKWCVAAVLCAAAFAASAAAAESQPCYGAEEKAQAKMMLEIMPVLVLSFIRQERAAKLVRQKTCAAIALRGRVSRIGYASVFFNDTRNRPVWMTAKERHMDPLRLQAALVDLIWPPISA